MTPESQSRGDARAWTQYWRSGHVEDMYGRSRTNLERFWFGYFFALPKGSRVLDLATGSGHVARLALRAGDGMRLGLDVTGVDYADIPGETVAPATPQHGRLTLMGNVAVERLPFADGAFDAVASQCGIEYADRDATTREIARVLKPGGRGLFVLHHKQSVITQMTTARLEARRTVLGDDPFAAARALFEHQARGTDPDWIAAAEIALRTDITGMRGRMGGGLAHENVAQTIAFLEMLANAPAQYDPADALTKLDAAAADSAAWEARQRAQTEAALDEAGIAAWVEAFAVHGVVAEPPLVIGNENRAAVGWRLAVLKAA